MSYTDAHTDAANRARAIVTVTAIHALIGAGVVAGLTITGAINADDPRLVAEFPTPETEPSPPPPETIPEPQPDLYVPPMAPRPLIELAEPKQLDIAPLEDRVPDELVLIPRPTATPFVPPARPSPSPTPSFAPVGPLPIGGGGWISNNDYPRAALTREQEGTVSYRLVVGSNGRVDACEITASSYVASLDRETCRLLERRARFEAATNENGAKVVGTYRGTVTWQIPD